MHYLVATTVLHRAKIDTANWRTAKLEHQTLDNAYQFLIHTNQVGVSGIASITVISNNPADHKDSVAKQYRMVTVLDSLPTLAFLDPKASVALAGNAFIHGDVAIQSGQVTKSSRYDLMAGSLAGFDGRIFDSTATIWKKLHFQFHPFFAWMDSGSHIPSEPIAEPQFISRSFDADPLQDTIRVLGILRIQRETQVANAFVIATEIYVEDSVSIRNATFCARKISIATKGIVAGEFYATDTILVNAKQQQDTPSVFAVTGRMNNGKVTGYLECQEWRGSGTWLNATRDWNPLYSDIAIRFSNKCHNNGTLLTPGLLDNRGQLTGHTIIGTLATKESVTLWQGFMLDGEIRDTLVGHASIPDILRFGNHYQLEEISP